ncbi:DUF11 domain-containing protein [Candidatus Saccharibacteria bacterium]|nr:DUF11 domain-containing protein [Candidatus Saccharibacteria bacterium]
MNQPMSFIKKIMLSGTVLGLLGISSIALLGKGSAAILPRDCDANAIFYCGSLTVEELKNDYNTNDENRYGDIPAIFDHFGISKTEINSISSKRGIVKADNTVWIDGKLVGVNAKTAGRTYKSGSTAIPGAYAYERSPSASFSTPSTTIDAMIGYENDVPTFAVLSACGNPVTWEHPPAPAIEMEKTVRSADNTKWVESDTFANNSTLTYRIVVRSTGKAADTNVVVRDTLPSYQTIVAGSVKVNGQDAGAAGNSIVGGGYTLSKVDAGATVEVTFQVKVSAPADKCGETAFVNKAKVDGDSTPLKEDTASGKVRVVCASIKCESLTASNLAIKVGEASTLTAKAALENAVLNSYEFRVNGQVVQNTSSNVYTYTATKEGTFAVKVVVKTDKGDATSLSCEVIIGVSKTPVCPYNPQLPPNSSECKRPEVCPYNSSLPLNSPDCKRPEVLGTTTILPKTGAGNLAAIFTITSVVGAAGHNLITRRRS